MPKPTDSDNLVHKQKSLCTITEDLKIQTVIDKTKLWVTESVIQHQFCPYAKQPYDRGIIDYIVCEKNDEFAILESLAHCCLTLDSHEEIALETSLLIIANDIDYLADFYDYLDVLDLANSFLANPRKYALRFSDEFSSEKIALLPKSWEETYQLASFHPHYFFEDADIDDKENYTNRSPYPIFHVLRNSSIDAVKMNDDKAHHIVERNCHYIRELNSKAFAKLVQLAQK